MNELTETGVHALHEALDDEYRAWATYDQVMREFGDAPPFSNIREAEARHIEALRNLFDRYGLPVPVNPWPGKATRYASLREACEACEAGVAAEIANGALYERLLASTQRRTSSRCSAICRRLRSSATCRRFGAAFSAGRRPVVVTAAAAALATARDGEAAHDIDTGERRRDIHGHQAAALRKPATAH